VAAFCDPAGGKRMELKRVRARSAIVVVGTDRLGRIFVLHTWADRCTAGQLSEKILKIQQERLPRVFGIEANAMQALYGEMVAREARHLGQRLPLLPVKQPTNVDKDWRIRTALQPIIGNDRLFLQAGQYELKAELTTFPMNPLKDLVDALASAVTLLRKPMSARVERADSQAYLEYLRSSNAPSWYVDAEAVKALDAAAARAYVSPGTIALTNP
jgi:hypothetical protein